MKKTIIILSFAVISLGVNAQHDHSSHSHNGNAEAETGKTDNTKISSSITVEQTRSVNVILDNYLSLKDALVGDNSAKAANSAKTLLDAFEKLDITTQSDSQQKELGEIIEDASEQAEHISENNGNIDHQREHFEILSTDLKDLIVITGSDRNLYQTFCPMYNNNEGGMWLSDSRVVMNPFYGSKMMKCGSVQQEITIE
jgi:hypothetical protein